MTFEVTIGNNSDRERWNNCIYSADHGTIFHTWDWLKIVEKHTRNQFYPFIVRKGEEIVAIYPIFLNKKKLFTMALSPPSKAYLLYLGPVLPGYDALKQSKKESVFTQIQHEIDHALFSELKCNYVRIRSSPGLFDSRPFRWAGYRVEPLYTYRVNLSKGFDSVNEQFDRKVRVSINRMIRDGVTVREGNIEDIDFILGALSTRYVLQGLTPSDYRHYLRNLYDVFYPDHLKILVAEFQGKRVGGSVYLCDKGIMYMWVGVPKTELKGIYPNDLIQWEAIKWACDNGYTYFEEMDGGTDPRLRHFKAKFNPELEVWYSAVNYSSFVYRLADNLKRIILRN